MQDRYRCVSGHRLFALLSVWLSARYQMTNQERWTPWEDLMAHRKAWSRTLAPYQKSSTTTKAAIMQIQALVRWLTGWSQTWRLWKSRFTYVPRSPLCLGVLILVFLVPANGEYLFYVSPKTPQLTRHNDVTTPWQMGRSLRQHERWWNGIHWEGCVCNRMCFLGWLPWPSLTVQVASTLSLYNAIELLTLIFLTFKRRAGLYFWSILFASFGILPYCLGWLITYFDLTHDYVGMIIETVGWVLVISGQSIVLYSRLHLILTDVFILRTVLTVIIVNGLIWVSRSCCYTNHYN